MTREEKADILKRNLITTNEELQTRRKIEFTCLKCGWIETRSLTHVLTSIANGKGGCKSCFKIKEDNHVISFIRQHVERHGGVCLESESYEMRSERLFTRKTKLKVKVCHHENYLTYDDASSGGYSGRCNSCVQGYETDEQIIETIKETGILISNENIKRVYGDRTYIVNFSYSCGCYSKKSKYSNLKKSNGECDVCQTVKRNRVNINRNIECATRFLEPIMDIKLCKFNTPDRGATTVTTPCTSCGDEFTRSLSYFNSSLVVQCSKCNGSMSSGESMIANILDNLSLKYSTEKSFKGLVGTDSNRRLRFDFYLENDGYANSIIEFDGQYHFDRSLPWFNEKIILHDNIKDKFCEDNDIPILRIPYFKANKAFEMISDFLNETKYEEELINV